MSSLDDEIATIINKKPQRRLNGGNTSSGSSNVSSLNYIMSTLFKKKSQRRCNRGNFPDLNYIVSNLFKKNSLRRFNGKDALALFKKTGSQEEENEEVIKNHKVENFTKLLNNVVIENNLLRDSNKYIIKQKNNAEEEVEMLKDQLQQLKWNQDYNNKGLLKKLEESRNKSWRLKQQLKKF